MKKIDFINYLMDEDSSGLTITDDHNLAIYAIDDIIVSGDFDMGMRGVDHNALLVDGIGWDELMEYGTIIVPENGTMIGDKHKNLPYEILPLNNNHINGFKNGGR